MMMKITPEINHSTFERIAMSYVDIAYEMAKNRSFSDAADTIGINRNDYVGIIHFPKVVAQIQINLAKAFLEQMDKEHANNT